MQYKIHTTIFFTSILCLLHSSLGFAQDTSHNYVLAKKMLNATGNKYTSSIQYYDKMGFPDVMASNQSGNYVYSIITYDGHGREKKKSLPLAGSSSPDYISPSNMESYSSNTYAGDNYGYNEISYDALDRIKFEQTPGAIWFSKYKGVSKDYFSNTDTNIKCFEFNSSTTGYDQNGCYPANSLLVEQTIDPDGHTVRIFKDNLGRIVLSRSSSNIDTYYIYDDKNQLRVVMPPMCSGSFDKDSLYCYRYDYDEYGNCIKKWLPGCEPIVYKYDTYNRLAFEYGGRIDKLHAIFYLYDELNRLAIKGIWVGSYPSDTDISTASQSVYYDPNANGIKKTSYVTKCLYLQQESNIEKLEIVNYYDNYNFLSSSIFNDAISKYSLDDANKKSTNTSSFLTGQVVFTSNGEPLYRVMYYDAKGRLIDARSTYPSQLYAQTLSTYTFTDKLSSVVTYYKYKGNALPFNKITHNYTYDQNSDILNKEQLFFNNNITKGFTTTYTYDNLGQIASKNLNSVLKNNYTYDIHGWLKNTVYFNQKNRTKYVPFAETLYYADGAGTPCYNGNISSLQYQSADTTLLKMLSYTYDGMNRLTASSFCASGMSGRYTEYFTYNKNSAIAGLVRWGKRFNGYNIIDNLKYSYTGNQLKAISDGVPGYYTSYTGASDYKDNTVQNQEYYYDGCGAMVQDRNKGISLINYDYNGMPTRIQFCNGNVTEFIYAADGTKLRTIHRISRSNLNVPYGAARTLTESETLSVDSKSYIGSLEIDRNFGGMYYFDDGYISLTNTASGTYHVFAKDHLGNVRAVVDSNGKIEQVYNYYAFGGLINDVTNTADAQPHKYNGKELDRVSGLELYDYGARNYDAAIGQFTTMDPLCEKYYGISPYAYCIGNPIRFIDPDGERPKASEAALMAAYVYKDKNKDLYRKQLRKSGWTESKFKTSIQMDYTSFDQNGLQSILFERTVDGVTEYAYVYAGTNSLEDMVEDVAQLAGASPQYNTAIYNAKTLSKELGDNELTFVGHSLGGGEAIASSMATGRAAITFNSAAVSELTKQFKALNKTHDVVNYRAIGIKIGIGNIRIGGDVLNNLQEKIGLSLPGKTIGIPTGIIPTHTIDDFLKHKLPEP